MAVVDFNQESLEEAIVRLTAENAALKKQAAPPTASAAFRPYAEGEPKEIRVWETPDGWTIASIHWSIIPDYDYESACLGLTPEAIRQELDLDWSATKGKRVYTDYGYARHVAVQPLPFNPKLPLYCGWDFLGTPAFVPTQMNMFGQWLLYPPLAPPEDETIGIYEFGKQVADHLFRNYAEPYGLQLKDLKLIHIGDPAGKNRPPRTGDRPEETQSCFDILKNGLRVHLGYDQRNNPVWKRLPGWGWDIKDGAINLTDRLEAVRSRLSTSLKDGLPALVLDPRAQVLIDGFAGGYHYQQRADGTYNDHEPKKNWYSHSLDAIGYVATRLFVQPKEEEDDDYDRHPKHEFRSHAAGRYAYQ